MSMVADLYPVEGRTRAMGVLTMGASLGSLVALIGGAWAVERIGWRATLAFVGLASVIAAFVMRWVVPEPQRLSSAQLAQESGWVAAKAVWAQPVARRLIIGAAFALLAGYSFGVWNFAYLMRGLNMSASQAGWITGLSALGSMASAPLSGAWVDRLVRRDRRWQMGVPLLGMGSALPLGWAYLSLGADQASLAIGLVIGFAFCIGFWVAPTYAALSLVVEPQRRAMASAIVLLVGAVGGSGFGPVLAGALSDALAHWVRGEPLGVALAIMLGLLLPAMAFFASAMRIYGDAKS